MNQLELPDDTGDRPTLELELPGTGPYPVLTLHSWGGVRVVVVVDQGTRVVVVVDQGERVLLAAPLPGRA